MNNVVILGDDKGKLSRQILTTRKHICYRRKKDIGDILWSSLALQLFSCLDKELISLLVSLLKPRRSPKPSTKLLEMQTAAVPSGSSQIRKQACTKGEAYAMMETGLGCRGKSMWGH